MNSEVWEFSTGNFILNKITKRDLSNMSFLEISKYPEQLRRNIWDGCLHKDKQKSLNIFAHDLLLINSITNYML